MLFDGTTGELLAVVNASAITAIRTAAVKRARRVCWRAKTRAIWQSSAPGCKPARI